MYQIDPDVWGALYPTSDVFEHFAQDAPGAREADYYVMFKDVTAPVAVPVTVLRGLQHKYSYHVLRKTEGDVVPYDAETYIETTFDTRRTALRLPMVASYSQIMEAVMRKFGLPRSELRNYRLLLDGVEINPTDHALTQRKTLTLESRSPSAPPSTRLSLQVNTPEGAERYDISTDGIYFRPGDVINAFAARHPEYQLAPLSLFLDRRLARLMSVGAARAVQGTFRIVEKTAADPTRVVLRLREGGAVEVTVPGRITTPEQIFAVLKDTHYVMLSGTPRFSMDGVEVKKSEPVYAFGAVMDVTGLTAQRMRAPEPTPPSVTALQMPCNNTRDALAVATYIVQHPERALASLTRAQCLKLQLCIHPDKHTAQLSGTEGFRASMDMLGRASQILMEDCVARGTGGKSKHGRTHTKNR